MSDIQFHIYNRNEFSDKVAPFCDDLEKNAIYKSPAFSKAWLETQVSETPKGREILFLSLWDNKSMIGLFPLCLYRFGTIRMAMPLGRDPISCQGVILKNNYSNIATFMAEEITKRKLFNLLYINDLSDHDPVTYELYEHLKYRKWSVHSAGRNCCYGVYVYDSLDQLKESYGERKSFQKLLRKERKLYKDYDVQVEHISSLNGSTHVIDRIIGIQQESWLQHRGNFMLKQNPQYRKLILNSLRTNHGHVYFLKLNHEDAAFAFGIQSGDKLCMIWTAFKEKYASNYSVGVMLIMHIIKNTYSKHIRSCYFCHGDSEWKRRLANHSLNITRTIAACGILPKITALCFYQLCLLHKNKFVNHIWMKVKKIRYSLERKLNEQTFCK